jgi:hypothetical protein
LWSAPRNGDLGDQGGSMTAMCGRVSTGAWILRNGE